MQTPRHVHVDLAGLCHGSTVVRNVINDNRKEITSRNHENTDLKREVRAENNKLTCKKLSAFEAFGGIPELQNRDKSTCDIVVPCLFLVICDFLIAITKTTSFYTCIT